MGWNRRIRTKRNLFSPRQFGQLVNWILFFFLPDRIVWKRICIEWRKNIKKFEIFRYFCEQKIFSREGKNLIWRIRDSGDIFIDIFSYFLSWAINNCSFLILFESRIRKMITRESFSDIYYVNIHQTFELYYKKLFFNTKSRKKAMEIKICRVRRGWYLTPKETRLTQSNLT